MKKILCLMLALVMIVGVMTACGNQTAKTSDTPASTDDAGDAAVTETVDPDDGTDASEDGAFKIGATGPLSGGAAIYGIATKTGAQIAVDEINALGGLQFELQYQDDEHDAEKAVNAYNILMDWNMQISLGSVTSTPGVATSVESFNDRIFTLTPSGSAVAITEGKDNVFQMCFADPNQGSASAQYISDNKLGTKVAIIYKNDDVYSTGIYETFVEKANELNLEIVSTTTFTEDSQTDFSVQLTDAMNKEADMIFLPMYYTPASLIFQQAKSMDYSPKYFGVDGMDGILTLEGFDAALAEGVMLLTPFNADAEDEATVKFVEKYKEVTGEIPNQFAADGYDAVFAIYEAIMADGTITYETSNEEICEKLIAQFTSFSFNGLTGDNMTWSEGGQVSKSPKGMVIQDGAYIGMD